MSPTAVRLRALRIAEGGGNSAAWAQRIGWSVTQLSNYENGIPLSKNATINLAQKIPGLQINWLWLGDENGLPVDLRNRLRRAEAEILAAGDNAELKSSKAQS